MDSCWNDGDMLLCAMLTEGECGGATLEFHVGIAFACKTLQPTPSGFIGVDEGIRSHPVKKKTIVALLGRAESFELLQVSYVRWLGG